MLSSLPISEACFDELKWYSGLFAVNSTVFEVMRSWVVGALENAILLNKMTKSELAYRVVLLGHF